MLLMVVVFGNSCASKPTEPQEAITNNMQVMREAVVETVKDVGRRQKLLLSIQSLEKTLIDYNKDYRDFAKALRQQNRIYDTPRVKLEEIIKRFRDRRKSAMEAVVALHFEMIANTSEEEWKKLVKTEVEAIKRSRQLSEDQLGG
jgi:hypothetical protein